MELVLRDCSIEPRLDLFDRRSFEFGVDFIDAEGFGRFYGEDKSSGVKMS